MLKQGRKWESKKERPTNVGFSGVTNKRVMMSFLPAKGYSALDHVINSQCDLPIMVAKIPRTDFIV